MRSGPFFVDAFSLSEGQRNEVRSVSDRLPILAMWLTTQIRPGSADEEYLDELIVESAANQLRPPENF